MVGWGLPRCSNCKLRFNCIVEDHKMFYFPISKVYCIGTEFEKHEVYVISIGNCEILDACAYINYPKGSKNMVYMYTPLCNLLKGLPSMIKKC